jgi:alpha-galactosidase
MKTLQHFRQIFFTGLIIILGACSNIGEGYNSIPSNFYPVEVKESTGVKLVGIGVELDPHFFSQNVTRPGEATAADWEIVKARVKKMGIQNFRVMLLPHWWEPVNDNADANSADLSKFTFESQEMQSLYKVLELAQEVNGEVTLVLWGCPINMDLVAGGVSGKHFLCDNRTNPDWVCGTDKYTEFAENFSVLVKHLVDTKGFTCVKAITPFNEPDSHRDNYGRMMWQGDGLPNFPDQYAPMAIALDAKFKTDGIRNKVRFNLSDNTDSSPNYLKSCAETLQAEADLFNTHTYIFGYMTPNADIVNWEKNNVAMSNGKNHFVGEFGSNQTSGSSRQLDIDKYERGVLLIRLVINFLNGGAAGVSYWSLIDQYYNRNGSYGEMQQLGLWKYVKKAYEGDPTVTIKADYEVRPHYYAYGMLTRFIKNGAEVFPLDLNEDLVAGTAILNEDNKWVYIFANGSEHNKPVEIINSKSQANGEYAVYKYVDGSLPAGDDPIESSKTINIDKAMLTIPRTGVLILVQK